MTIDPREKVVLFIDGANLYATSKAIVVSEVLRVIRLFLGLP